MWAITAATIAPQALAFIGARTAPSRVVITTITTTAISGRLDGNMQEALRPRQRGPGFLVANESPPAT